MTGYVDVGFSVTVEVPVAPELIAIGVGETEME